ncbi:cell division protein FtsW [Butyrivibrio hungatei DSM 14810]|uniref:Probable peptidoglycan glycosyltransferase FtsW n=1 Tax=Butyrivibrio hungatei DSM 14810 TaxID=1121132 RepID=A0A1M7S974_9FIRM|nr:putative peptidoglycan glycosyltransferase FtsW [Butyrivibrio hungatei]SHN55209.1 cell division protein FtsW [Butyrivibrio hungatei DSM 14810]
MEKTRFLKKPKVESYVDYSLIFIILFLLAFGLVMLYSTSSYEANLDYGDSAYYFKHQLVPTLIGLALMIVMSYFPYGLLKKLAFPIYIGAAVLLLLLIPFGREINHAKRWIFIMGISIQPAEVAKFAVIVFTATIIVTLKRKLLDPKGYFTTLGFPALLALMVYGITKNLSSAIIIMGIAVVMLFISTPGYKKYVIAALSVLALATVIVLIVAHSANSSGMNYRFKRILVWLDPAAYASEKGFQTIQALYAIGSGGIFGKGLGESMQKMGFIPEAQNDMIFSIICEELGLFGAIAVMLMFMLLIWRLMIIANNAPDMFGALLVIGVMGHIAIQVVLNIAVVTNTIPNTGITLPFISYGGSAVIMQLAEIGMALNVAKNIG